MSSSFRMIHRVEFADTDMAGIVHFARYFRYMEVTEHAFFRSLGFSVADRARGIGWPRVEVGCAYRAPLRFEDEVEVELRVVRKSERSLGYRFHFRKVGSDPPLEVAQGWATTVCVSLDPATGEMRATPIPPDVAQRIEVAP